jgi:hypothetical protein
MPGLGWLLGQAYIRRILMKEKIEFLNQSYSNKGSIIPEG